MSSDLQSQLSFMTISVHQKSVHPLKRSFWQESAACSSPRMPMEDVASPSSRLQSQNNHHQQHRRSNSETSVLSWSSSSPSRMPSSKPPRPSHSHGHHHRRQKSAPARSASVDLTFSPIMVDPEVAKYETAILKLKASCPPTPSQSHSSCHDDDCDDYQLHVAKIAKVYDALGNYYFSCRAWQDAIYAFSQALTMFRVAHNGDMNQDPAIASTYINLGNTYWKVDGHGRHKEASVCMEQALRIRRVTLGSDDLETSAALHLNGQALCLLGDHESLTKAKHLLGEALEIRQDCHLVGLEQGGSGDDMHMLGMEVARTESLVGHAHKGLGENEDALHMYIEALRQKVTVLNTKQHSSVVASLVDIANLYRSMDGRLSDALDMYQQVLEIQSAIIVNSAEQEHEHRNNNSSADYMDVGMTLHTLGNISRELGNKVADAGADAQTYYSRAAIMYKQAGRDVNHNCFVLLRQSMSQCR